MNGLIDKLLPFERNLFLALNGSESIFWDNAMWTFTGIVTWVPMVLFILYIVFRNQLFKEALLVLVSIALAILLSDQLSSSFFKPLFHRYRPSHHPDYKDIVDLVKGFRGGQFGFISGHATNSFALAVFFSYLFKNRFVTIFILLWAVLNSYSRIYLGVHFISDILGGFVFGSLIGFLVYNIYVLVRVRFYKVPTIDKRKSIYSKNDSNTLAIGIISYMVLVIVLSPFLTSISHSIIPKAWF